MSPSNDDSDHNSQRISFSPYAWEDFQYWVQNDPQIAKRIVRLVTATYRDPFHGIGHPEPLKHELQGFWSRRITQEHRIVYKCEDGTLFIVQCRYHYSR